MSINGGIGSLEEAKAQLAAGMDGVMIGRAAYHRPADILGPAMPRSSGKRPPRSAEDAVLAMLPYIEDASGPWGGG
jgi:tRNA-dihydrouridine synthase A